MFRFRAEQVRVSRTCQGLHGLTAKRSSLSASGLGMIGDVRDSDQVADAAERTVGEWQLPPRVRLFYVAVSAFITASIGGSFVVVSVLAPSDGESVAWLVLLPVGLALIYLGARATIKIWRAHLQITSGRIVVAGPLATHHVELDDADRFVASLLEIGNGQPIIQLMLRNGDPISVFVFLRNGWVWNMDKVVAKLEPQAAVLNDTLAAARAVRSVSAQAD